MKLLLEAQANYVQSRVSTGCEAVPEHQDLSGEEPAPTADPVITATQLPEKATLEIKVNGWKPQVHFHFSAQGPSSWVPLYFALVLLLATVATFLATQLLPPGATWLVQALVAAGTGGAVLTGGVALLFLWPRIRKH